jgi:hypothetical protein
MNKELSKIDFTRINNDVNGNPRYVCHYLDFKHRTDNEHGFSYLEALQIAKPLGGRKFHNKQYGGGIVFQSYNIQGLENKILILTGYRVEYTRPANKYEATSNTSQANKPQTVSFDLSEVTNRSGQPKKWFKLNGVKHSIKK